MKLAKYTKQQECTEKTNAIIALGEHLKAKEQECEELKEECEALKLENQELYTILADLKEVRKLKDEYMQKCEELKKPLETSEEWRIKAESLNEKLELRNTCYRKALEEIEEIINNILNSCLGRNTVGCRPAHNVCGDLIKILDIINKAKGR